MTVMALDTRRAHQREVSALLDEVEERRKHLYRLKAGGAKRAGLRDLIDESRRRRSDSGNPSELVRSRTSACRT